MGLLQGSSGHLRVKVTPSQATIDYVRAYLPADEGSGKTNDEIGSILDISTFTVKNHLQRIFKKIDVVNRSQAVAKILNQVT